jgi:acetyl-CoA acetyltransferase
MGSRDVVITGYAETPMVLRSGLSVFDLAADVLEELTVKYGIAPGQIDGLAVTASLSEARNPFHAAFLSDALGLELSWLGGAGTGGCAMLSAVSAAASALRDELCNVVLVIGADAPSTRFAAQFGGYIDEFQAPAGAASPPTAFALLQRAYIERNGPIDRAHAKIVLTQREHALPNDRALEKLRTRLTEEDYLGSRVVADPIRLLDSVMFCDGANGVLMMREETAATLGFAKQARIAGYAEHTNYQIRDPAPDLLDSGFSLVGQRVAERAGIAIGDVDVLELYDDFTIAVLLQLEQLGLCGSGEGSDFVSRTDLSFAGQRPLNTGGGQLSCGQPGLAAGGLPLVEAVRQLFNEGGATQVKDPRTALVTGIGGLAYGRSWLMSSAMVLEK